LPGKPVRYRALPLSSTILPILETKINKIKELEEKVRKAEEETALSPLPKKEILFFQGWDVIKKVIKKDVADSNEEVLFFIKFGKIDWGERYFKLDENKKIIPCSKEESLVFASISIISFRFFEFLNKVNASTLHDKQLLDFLVEEGMLRGEIMNVERAVNVNYIEDLEKVKEIEKEKSKTKISFGV